MTLRSFFNGYWDSHALCHTLNTFKATAPPTTNVTASSPPPTQHITKSMRGQIRISRGRGSDCFMKYPALSSEQFWELMAIGVDELDENTIW